MLSHRSGSRRAAAALVLVAAHVWFGALAAAAATPADDVCGEAAELVEHGRPEAALDLITRLREAASAAGDCAPERTAALAAIGDAQRLAAIAQDHLDAGSIRLAGARALAALELDADNEDAAAVRNAVRATSAGMARSRWDDLSQDYLEPAADIAVTTLAVAAAALVAARLLTLAMSTRHGRTARAAVRLQVAGVLAALAGGLATAWLLPTSLWWAVGAGLLLLGSVACLHQAWAGALRVRIDVSEGGSPSTEAAGHVVGLLGELGAEPPRGLEVPRGTDAQELNSAGLAALPQTAVAAAAFRLLELLLPRSPWRVRVDVESADLMSVAVSRNGRHVASAVVDRDALGLRISLPTPAGEEATQDPRHPCLHRAAAAVVLIALAKEHSDLRSGLCGASDWRSLALHAIATTDLENSDHRDEVLARALRYQPDNMLAQVAFRYYRDHESTDRDVLKRYIAWLTATARTLEAHSPLHRRVLMSRAAAAINLWFLGEDPLASLANPDRRDAKVATQFLVQSLREKPTDPLALEMRPSAGAMYRTAWRDEGEHGDEARDWSRRSALSPQGLYNVACMKATLPRRDPSAAVHSLSLASVDARYKAWRSKDPQLGDLRQSKEYRSAFHPDRKKDFLTLPPLAPHRTALRAAGIHDARSLAREAHGSPGGLATYLHVDRRVVDRLTGLADLGVLLEPKAGNWTREICAELLKLDLDRPRQLWPETVATSVHRALRERLKESPGEKELRGWLPAHRSGAQSR